MIRKTYALLGLIACYQPDISKICLHGKNLYEAKCQVLANKCKSLGLKYCDDPKAFVEFSNDIDDTFENIDEYNPNKKHKILIVFDDVIAYVPSNKKLNLILTELLIRCRKLNISLVFYHTMLFHSVKKNIKTLIYYEKFKDKRALAYCN